MLFHGRQLFGELFRKRPPLPNSSASTIILVVRPKARANEVAGPGVRSFPFLLANNIRGMCLLSAHAPYIFSELRPIRQKPLKCRQAR